MFSVHGTKTLGLVSASQGVVTGWASSLSEAGEGGVRDKPGLRPTWESKCTEEPARH